MARGAGGYNSQIPMPRLPHPPVIAGRRLLAVAACAAAVVLAGCQTVDTPSWWGRSLVYRMDVNQGNYVTQDMVDRLKVGQTRQQVRLALGTPLVQSAFHDNRWDYVYQFQSAGRVRENRQFTVYFNKDETLARWEGDEMPQSVQDLNRIAATRVLPEDPYGQDAGLIGKVIDFFRNIWDPGAPPVK